MSAFHTEADDPMRGAPRARYVGGERMKLRQQQAADAGAKLRAAIELAHEAAQELLKAMPTWSDITATQAIALGERAVVWGIIDEQHHGALDLARQIQQLRRAGFWACHVHQDIPTAWTTQDSLDLFRSPESWGLTREQAEELRAQRTETFARLESLAATGTALLPTTEVTP